MLKKLVFKHLRIKYKGLFFQKKIIVINTRQVTEVSVNKPQIKYDITVKYSGNGLGLSLPTARHFLNWYEGIAYSRNL